MGIRITKGADLDVRLEKIADRSTRALRKVHRDSAYALKDTVEEMVPFKTGELEGSVDVVETRERGNWKDFTVEASSDHAIYMHEGIYDLGPGSVEKQQNSKHRVGRKFMERGVQWLHQDWGFREKLVKAMKGSKK